MYFIFVNFTTYCNTLSTICQLEYVGSVTIMLECSVGAGLPEISGEISDFKWGCIHNTGLHWGALGIRYKELPYIINSEFRTDLGTGITFNASASNGIYGASNTVTPISLKAKYLIRF